MNDDDSRLNIDRPSLQLLAALLLDRVGLKITPDGYYGLRLALVARMPALGLFDASEYVRRLRQLAGETELRALLPLVTVGKTEFFRDARQFQGLEQVLLLVNHVGDHHVLDAALRRARAGVEPQK